MAKIRIVGDSSGYVELAAPNAAGNNTLELPSNATKLVGADASNSLNVTGIATFSGGITVGTGASISSPATNVLTLGTNNSERVRITSGGAIGIGTTNPARKFSLIDDTVYGGGFLDISEFLVPNAVSGNSVSINFGKSSSTNNLGKITYSHTGDGSSNNYLGLGFFNNDNILNVGAGGSVGIGITNPSAVLHARESNTKAPSLTWGASCGQIFRNENSEFALGLSNQSPYPLWIQGRTLSSTRRDIVVNPLGGNFGVGVVPWDGTTDGLNFKTLVANYQANGSMTTSSWADTSITLTAASNFVFAKIIAVGHENGRNNGFREYFVSWNVHAGWSTNLLVTSNQGNDYGLVDVRMNGSTVQVKAVNNASTGQYRLYVTHYLT